MVAKKLYYKIGEACKKLDIQPYVLRYWETEFAALSPNKSKSGQRVYSDKDLHIIGRIKELLYEEGFTIAGAKKKLEAEIKSGLKPLRKPTAKSGKPATAAEEAADTAAAETAAIAELKQLRKAIDKALKQAREIQSLLDSKKKSR